MNASQDEDDAVDKWSVEDVKDWAKMNYGDDVSEKFESKSSHASYPLISVVVYDLLSLPVSKLVYLLPLAVIVYTWFYCIFYTCVQRKELIVKPYLCWSQWDQWTSIEPVVSLL